MSATIINEKEAMSLNKNTKGYMEGFGGRKRKECNYIMISKDKAIIIALIVRI